MFGLKIRLQMHLVQNHSRKKAATALKYARTARDDPQALLSPSEHLSTLCFRIFEPINFIDNLKT